MRKEANLEVSDRITLTFNADDETANALAAFDGYIRTETLAVSIAKGTMADALLSAESDLNGHNCTINLKK